MSVRTCIFIDGENLRHSLQNLLPKFNRIEHYLPYADWGNMFEAIVTLASRKSENQLKFVRAYWYVIDEIQYNTYFQSSKFSELEEQEKTSYFDQYVPSLTKGLSKLNKEKRKECFELLNKNANIIDTQRKRWKEIESNIQSVTDKLQFQRFGYLQAKLDDGRGVFKFLKGREKGVDIKLATDLMDFAFRDIYDVAIIVSGDGDYIPVVNAVKNMGKHVAMVDFKNREGKFLPGGSRKLKEHCDFSFSLNYRTMYDICRYGLQKEDPPKKLDLDSDYNF